MQRLKAGGALQEDHVYIRRMSDSQLPAALDRHEYCYVLAPRMQGKSSLLFRTAKLLRAQGMPCAIIDLLQLGAASTTPEEFYYGLLVELASEFKSPDPDFFWQQHAALAPLHRWFHYIRTEFLVRIERPVVVFIDEIDMLPAMKNVSSDDFLGVIRSLYNLRADSNAYEKLVFCLLGAVPPGELIADERTTPFNIGCSIPLEDFTRQEMEEFAPFLATSSFSTDKILDQVYSWTSGHPYMTQKLLSAWVMQNRDGNELGATVERLARNLFSRYKSGEDEYLAKADRYFDRDNSVSKTARMLRLYDQLLTGSQIAVHSHDSVQNSLRMSGIASICRDGEQAFMQVRNKVFAQLFDAAWVQQKWLDRQIREPLARWLEGARADALLLSAAELEQAQKWAYGRNDLTSEENEFILRSATHLRLQTEREVASLHAVLATSQKRFRLALGGSLLSVMLVVGLWSVASIRGLLQHSPTGLRPVIEQTLAPKPMLREESDFLLPETTANSVAVPMKFDSFHGRKESTHRKAGRSTPSPSITATPAATPKVEGTAPPAEISDGSITALSSDIEAVARAVNNNQTVSRQAHMALLTTLERAMGQTVGRVLHGPRDYVSFIRYTADGSRIVAASLDGDAYIWDRRSIRLLATLSGQHGPLSTAALSADGRYLGTGSEDGESRIWDAHTGNLIASLRGHTKRINTIRFSPQGDQLVTASDDATARIWTVNHGVVYTLKADHDAIRSASFSSTGDRVLTASWNGSARIWDAAKGKQLLHMMSHAYFQDAAFSSDGMRVLTLSEGSVRIWNAGTGKELCPPLFHEHKLIHHAVFSPDGARLITTDGSGGAHLWNGYTGEHLSRLQTDESSPLSPVFSPDGSRAVAGNTIGTLWLWDAKTGEERLTVRSGVKSPHDLAFSADGEWLLDAGEGGTIKEYPISGAALLQTACHYVRSQAALAKLTALCITL